MLDEQLVPTITRCSSGCAGLDDVLGGGLPIGHFYLVEGEPGTGKTTLALQFIAEGLKNGEKVLYVTLSESRDELLAVAQNHGLDIEGHVVLEVRPSEQDLTPEGQYTVFHPSEVELNDRVQAIMGEVNRRKPTRLVIDALSEVRMLAKDPLRYRRQILSLKEYAPENCTVLLLDDRSSRYADLELHSIVHGVVSMSRVPREYGKTIRRVEVTKLRGCAFREGYHDYMIRSGGVVVFPRLVAAEYTDMHQNELDGHQRRSGARRLSGWRAGSRDQHPADRSGRMWQDHDSASLAHYGSRARREIGCIHFRRKRQHADETGRRSGHGHLQPYRLG